MPSYPGSRKANSDHIINPQALTLDHQAPDTFNGADLSYAAKFGIVKWQL
jgi:hypothetical protein